MKKIIGAFLIIIGASILLPIHIAPQGIHSWLFAIGGLFILSGICINLFVLLRAYELPRCLSSEEFEALNPPPCRDEIPDEDPYSYHTMD